MRKHRLPKRVVSLLEEQRVMFIECLLQRYFKPDKGAAQLHVMGQLLI